MPHLRKRYLRHLLKKSLSFSSIVGIFGQRQTGKTTLVTAVATEFISLDQRIPLSKAEENPENFLEERKTPFAIDECQMAPGLFPALKEKVRVFPKKGQFILTGSVRFTSRAAIRESLTGRIFILELFPMNLSEISQRPLNNLSFDVLAGRYEKDISFHSPKYTFSYQQFKNYLLTGGLPGILFYRENFIRKTKFESHIETLLERDLRLVLKTTLDYRTLRGLLAYLAVQQGKPLEYAEVSRATKISYRTLLKVLRAFEALFLIRIIETTGGEKKPVAFLEDQGMATHLVQTTTGFVFDEMANLERGLFTNIRPQFFYRLETSPLTFQYRTRGGAYVPFAFQTTHGVVGYIPILGIKAPVTAVASARSFIRQYPNAKVILVHQGKSFERIEKNIYAFPIGWVL